MSEQTMRQFYRTFPNRYTRCSQLRLDEFVKSDDDKMR